jgi:hypothetical protein
MPDTTAKLLNALGEGEGESLALEHARFGLGSGGTTIGALDPLFPKVEA